MFSGWFGNQQQEEQPKSQVPGVHATITFHSTMEQAMKVITDYDSYTEFLKNVDQVKTVKVERDEQTGRTICCHVKWQITVAFNTVSYTLILRENESGDGIVWDVSPDDKGPFSKNVGGWNLRMNENGDQVEATYYMDVEFNVWLPGFLKDMLLGKSLPDTMNAFKNRIESLNA